jgi:hypothetical protein
MDITDYIGMKTQKRSNKPFKSGNKINTITGVTMNPNTNKYAFTFEEDDSIVDIRQCVLIDANGNLFDIF